MTLLYGVQTMLSNNEAVSVGILNPYDAPLIGAHAYSVVRVTTDAQGVPNGVVLRNPWGFDGAGDDGANDGYVTVSAAQFFKACWRVQGGIR